LVPFFKKSVKSPLRIILNSLPSFQILREINSIIHTGKAVGTQKPSEVPTVSARSAKKTTSFPPKLFHLE